MADYFGTSINESPTIVLEAGKDIEGARELPWQSRMVRLKSRQPVQMLSAYHCLRMMRK